MVTKTDFIQCSSVWSAATPPFHHLLLVPTILNYGIVLLQNPIVTVAITYIISFDFFFLYRGIYLLCFYFFLLGCLKVNQIPWILFVI